MVSRKETVGQITEAFSKVKSRGKGAKRLIAERVTAAPADIPGWANGSNRLVFVVLKKLIENVECRVVEPVCALWLATFWMLYPSPMVSAVRGNTSREMSVEVSKTFTGGCPGFGISLGRQQSGSRNPRPPDVLVFWLRYTA